MSSEYTRCFYNEVGKSIIKISLAWKESLSLCLSSLEMCSEEVHRKVMRQFGGAIAGEYYFLKTYL